jgi:putative ABC transport system substrate-binding protein
MAARAQQAGKLPTIGFFSPRSAAAARSSVAALVQRLGELGWIEGRTVAIQYRWADEHDEQLAAIADEFARLKVDVIVTHATAPVRAAKQATAVIPIVFASAADPVSSGLVASLSRPGGNVTGISSLTVELAGKRLELLRELIPSVHRLAIMSNADGPGAVLEMADVRQPRARSGLRSSHQKFDEPRISRLHSRRSKAVRMHFML